MAAVDLDPDQLRALAAVVGEGTFDAAARTLDVTPSAISQRIGALERRVGRVLVRRTRPVTATASGEVLLRAARQLEALAADVSEELELGAGSGGPRSIPLAVNADTLATWLLPALAPLAGELSFDLRRDDETRTATLLRDGTVTAAITGVRESVPGCTVRRLGAMRYRACAAPRFAARWLAAGPTAEALARAPIVVFDRGDELQDRWLRRHTRRALSPPRHHVPGSEAFVSAVALGLGWGLLPDLQSRDLRDRGELVALDPRPVDVALYWQQWRLRSSTVDRVADAVVAGAAAALSR